MDINDTPHTLQLYIDRHQTTQAKMYECFAANQLYEPGLARLFAEVLQAGDCVVDVGAHIGYFTLLAATLVGPHGKVFAFELDEENANQLSANIALNNYTHVVPCRGAVGSANTTVPYFLNADDEGGHALWDIGGQLANARSGAPCHTRSVEMMTLDAVLSQQELAAVKLIKISAEGAEYDVILGGTQTLIKYDVPYIVCRLHPFALRQMGQAENELRSFMGSIGYAASILAPDGVTLQPLTPEEALDETSSVTVVFTKLHLQTDTLPYPRIF
jgi:FkbM family methyltransferase